MCVFITCIKPFICLHGHEKRPFLTVLYIHCSILTQVRHLYSAQLHNSHFMAIIALGSNFSSFLILNNAGGLGKAMKLKHTEKRGNKKYLSVASTSGL